MTIELGATDRVTARWDDLVLATDQDGTAPSPFDLFLASIGTCAGIYVARFCRQRKIPTDGVRIRERVVRSADNGLVTGIELDLELPSGFPASYADAAVRAAQLCTVKKHLEHPPAIRVRALVTHGA